MTTASTSNTTQVVNTFLSKDHIMRNLYASVYEKFADLSEDIPQQKGQVITWIKWARLTPKTTALTEGVTPTESLPTKSAVSATVAQYGDFIKYTDKLKISADSKPLQAYNELLSEESAEIKDLLCEAELASATNIVYSGTATATAQVADNLDNDDMRIVAKQFRENRSEPIKAMLKSSPNYDSKSVPASYILITDTDVEYDLREDTKFIAIEDYGANMKPIHKNEYGALKSGFRCIRTDHGAQTKTGSGSGGVDVHISIALAKRAFGVTKIVGGALESILKPLGYKDELDQVGSVGFKMLYVAKILNEDNIIVIESAATST